jgi:hypothetical protein
MKRHTTCTFSYPCRWLGKKKDIVIGKEVRIDDK